jgi:hypothetical protein
MGKNLKVVLSAVALAALVAAPAIAKSRTHTEHTAPAVVYRNSTVILPGQVPGTDPDPRIRAEARRQFFLGGRLRRGFRIVLTEPKADDAQ